MLDAHRRRRIMRRTARSLLATVGVGAIAGALVAACSGSADPEPGASRIVYGPSQALGQGTARVFVTLDGAQPTSIGVALSETAMTGLPTTPIPGRMSAADLFLVVPDEAKITGFDHVMLDWNPTGHDPQGVYTIPHFDFHFFTIPIDAQMAIVPSDPDFTTKAEQLPPAEFQPVGMFKLPGGVPMMGAHWADPTSPELLPAPNTQPFTRTFLYGSYAGHFIFLEPMITKAHVESVKSGGSPITSAIKLPAKYEQPGYSPTHYGVSWNAQAKEYRIALDGLTHHN